MKKILRYRNLFLFGGALLALIASVYSDPDGGLATALGGLALIQGVWAVTAAHLARKALMDYKDADQRTLFQRAAESPVGAGLALLAMAITFLGLLLVFSPRAHAETVPDGFFKYGPVLKVEQETHWPNHPDPVLLFALVEQESCSSLKSPWCWNPKASLKTAREEGAGMGQITRAYSKSGAQRFDSLAGLVEQYGRELEGLSWSTVYDRPDLQLRAVVLMARDAAKPFAGNSGWLAFGDAAYNGGTNGVRAERRACKLAGDCDPGKWFGNVERHCLKSRQPLYGTRSACDINREHVRNVMLVRAKKYRAYQAAL